MSIKDELIEQVSIQEYFNRVIIPNMDDYYEGISVDFDFKPTTLCPLHDESTPSFRYYPETRSFYCFGCLRGGNIISLHRYFIELRISGSKPDYRESERYLYETFIGKSNIGEKHLESKSGKKVNTVSNKSGIRVNNTIIDLARFNRYINDLNNSIYVDESIGIEDKIKVYKEIDNIDTLVNLGVLSCDDARDELDRVCLW